MESEWLRTQLTSFTCPCCGDNYRGSKICLLAERDGLYFVDLDCTACGSRTVAIVTVELDDAEASIADLASIAHRPVDPADKPRPGAQPVSADDLLAMHSLLAQHRGDLAALLANASSDGAEQR